MATMDDSVILPPPDIRAIADKTAEFVSRNGVEFEARIIATNAGNPKFRFMNSDDVYRMYFDFKVREFREKRLSAAMESEQKRDAPPETPQQTTVPAPAAPEAEAVRWACAACVPVCGPPSLYQLTCCSECYGWIILIFNFGVHV